MEPGDAPTDDLSPTVQVPRRAVPMELAAAELRGFQRGQRSVIASWHEEAARVRSIVERYHAELPRGPDGDPLLTEETIAALLEGVSAGAPLATAAQAIDLTWGRLADWQRQGAADVAAGQGGTLAARLSRLTWQAAGVVRAGLASKAVHEGDRQALEVLARRDPEAWAPALPEQRDPSRALESLTLEELDAEHARILESIARRRRALAAAPEAGHTPDGLCPSEAEPAPSPAPKPGAKPTKGASSAK